MGVLESVKEEKEEILQKCKQLTCVHVSQLLLLSAVCVCVDIILFVIIIIIIIVILLVIEEEKAKEVLKQSIDNLVSFVFQCE